MALIEAYKLTPRELSFEGNPYAAKNYAEFVKRCGGFDSKKKTVTKMKWEAEAGFDLWPYLDSLTGAVEAGLVDDEKWPSQLFASKQDLAEFAAALHNYHDWRIIDRWYQALGFLGEFDDDGLGVTSCLEMADSLWERAIDDLGAFKEAPEPKAVAKKASVKTAVKTTTKKKAKA